MSDSIELDLKKLLMAGVGAVALVTEKSKEVLEELSKKGESAAKEFEPALDALSKKGAQAFEQGCVFGEEIKSKVCRAFEECDERINQMEQEDINASLDGLTDEALYSIKAHAKEILEKREMEAEKPEHSDEPNTNPNP